MNPQYPGGAGGQPGAPWQPGQPGYPQQPGQPMQQPGAPQQYGQPVQQPYGAPPQYGHPTPQQYGQPAPQPYGAAPQYGQPAPQQPYAAPQPGMPMQPGAPQPYGQPAPQPYGQPAPQPYGAPQPGMQPPMTPPQFGGAPGAPQPYGAPQPGMPQQPYGVPQPGFGAPGAAPQVQTPHVTNAATAGGILQDLSGDALMGAVLQGRGFHSPRLLGAAMVGLAIVLAIINTVTIFVFHWYYPYLYAIGAIIGWGGAWLVVTGQPGISKDGSPPPIWGRIGLGAAMVIGLLMGIGVILSVHWMHELGSMIGL